MKKLIGKIPTLFINILIAATVGIAASAYSFPAFQLPVFSSARTSVPESGGESRIVPSAAESSLASLPESLPSENSAEPEKQNSSDVSSYEAASGMVGKDYFDDALFIGDSITEGLMNYGGISNAKFFCRVGLSIYQLFENPKQDVTSGLTLEQMLQGRHFGKIYILLGINELGTANTDYFVRHYSNAIAKIQQYDPDAVYFVESILPVTEKKSESGEVFTNENIRARNKGLQTLENGKNIFYLDLSPALDDGSGNMCADYSGDGVHIKAKNEKPLVNYLRVCTAEALKRAEKYG